MEIFSELRWLAGMDFRRHQSGRKFIPKAGRVNCPFGLPAGGCSEIKIAGGGLF